MPNFLALDLNDGGGQCAAYIYTNATPTKLGDSFGVAYTLDPDNQAGNMVLQFCGQLYAMASDGIYQKDNPLIETGPWTQQIAFVGPAQLNIVGMFVVGTEIVGLYPTADGTFRWVKFDGTTWTQAASSTNAMSNNPRRSSVVVYHDVIYWIGSQNGGSTGRAFSYDPASDTFTNLDSAYSTLYSGSPGDLCVFEDRLLVIGHYDSGGARTIRLGEFNGSTFISLQTFEPQTNNFWSPGKWALFTDGTNMWALAGDDTGGFGWRCYEWDTSLVRSEITATVVPTALRYTGAAGGAYGGTTGIRTARFSVLYDLNSVVGVTSIYLYHTTNGTDGLGFAAHLWNGNAALMTQVDAGGNVSDALPCSHLHLGEHIFTPGELDVKITLRMGVLGGEKIYFTVTGGGTGRTVRMHHLLQGTPPLLSCSIVGPVTGGSATLGVDQIENVDADGVTVYSFIWNTSADGLDASNRVIRAPQALV